MIDQGKCTIVGIVCIVVLAFNISIPYLSSNVAKQEINEEKINRCKDWQLQCKNGQCIAKSFICDKMKNCQDSSDETYIQCGNNSSTKYKECIEKKYQCDDIKQCTDKSDELHEICNVLRNQPSPTTRIKRDVDKSCAVPAPSAYKNVTFTCNTCLSRTCDPSRGHVPEFTIAKVTCAGGYSEENEKSSVHFCYKEEWVPAIRNCKKKCDKLNATDVSLNCYRNGVQIFPCNENSILLAGTKVRPLCKSPYTYDSSQNYFEITCNDDGKWNASLPHCVPQCGKPLLYTEEDDPSRIGKGQEEKKGSSPWNVAVFDKNKKLICGGTIISANIVLSAAHCFNSNGMDTNRANVSFKSCERFACIDDFEIVVGKHTSDYNTIDDADHQKTMKIKEIRFPTDGYEGPNTHYTGDLAILILREPIPITPEILPACLNWTDLALNKHPLEGALGKVAGWGRTESDTLSKDLKTTNLTIISRRRCLEMVHKDFQSFVTIDKFCAAGMLGNSKGATLMDRDSGGGILIEDNGFYYLQGIVSVKPTSSVDNVTVFTDLSKHIAILVSTYNNIEQNSSHINQMKLNDGLFNQEVMNYINQITLDDATKKAVVEAISSAFINDNSWSTVEQLRADIADKCEECAVQIYNSVVETVWDKITVEELLSRTRKNLKDAKEMIAVHLAVIDQLQPIDALNSSFAVMLAQYMNEAINFSHYHEVDQSLRSHYEMVKNKLLQSVNVKPQFLDEIADDIYSQRFPEAQQKLLNESDDTYYRVVHELYNNQADNFDLLLKFGDSIENIEQKFKIYKYLYNETTSNGFIDALMLLRFSKAVKQGILDQSSRFSAAEQLFQNLNNATIKAAVEQISLGFINDDSWSTVEQLSSADIAEECNECTDQIYSSVVEKVWCKITIEDLLTRANELWYISETIAIHVATADKLERIAALNERSAVMLTFYMNLTMNLANYNKVNSSLRSPYEEAAKKLFQYHQNWKEAIVKPAVELISSAVENNNLWLTVEKLSADIYDVCEECSLKIFSLVIDTVWNKVTLFDLLDRTYKNLRYPGEMMNIYLAVKNKLELTSTFYTTSAITLARFMKQTMDCPNYKTIDSSKRSQYERITNKLPQSVRNLVFSSTICIKNTKFNKNISAGVFSTERNAHLLYTFTPDHKDQQSAFKWNVVFIGLHDIYLRNDYFCEYLYVDTATRDDLLRYVFTSSTDTFNKNHVWELEVDGDNIRLRSKIYKEYLCVGSIEGGDESKPDLFTCLPGRRTNESTWEIHDCS